ncbi:MAG: hypothetical protein IJJ26_03015 [Victivallales bacterium]|nr:hypothetical protein [Victivallales bacterium]
MKNLHRVTLELSSKPFVDTSEATARGVAEHLFTQWMPLIREADAVAVMLWISDGSELLCWSGDLEQEFEWAYWIGCAMHILPRPEHPTKRDLLNIHTYPKKYREGVGPRPYSWLKMVISIIKEVGRAITGKDISIIYTFDNGPEFALSKFKYETHTEICGGSTVGGRGAVVCNSTLHADTAKYAAFPQGIPEGITLGSFMGAQFREFSKTFDIDGIWLSNGMGFGRSPWGIIGFLFDKEKFSPEDAPKAAETMLQFWHDITTACPGIRIENRGSNFSAGVEMASDGAPLAELYDDYKIVPPVNSPWAALNYNTGLEIAAWMSHIAVLPADKFPFRFYTHDPWFLNSPWLDRYERIPWDIYQPMAISRLRADGTTQTAERVSFLTCDDTLGRLPDQVPQEVIPHILQAWRTAADAAGPFVWLYPFHEYNDLVRNHGRSDQVLREDLFLGESLQDGFPLNTVVSTDVFRENPATVPSTSILVVPVAAYAGANIPAIDSFLERGNVIFYGGLAHADPRLLEKLGLKQAEPVTGKVTIRSRHIQANLDFELAGDECSDTVNAQPLYTEGGLCAVAASDDSCDVFATAVQGDTERVVVAVRDSAAFVEAILPVQEMDLGNRGLERRNYQEACPTGFLMQVAMAAFGWEFSFGFARLDTTIPRTTIARHDNAFLFNIFARDTTVQMSMETPWGAPVFTGMESRIATRTATSTPLGRLFQHECRLFVKSEDTEVVSASIRLPGCPEYRDRRYYIGFIHADITFFPPLGVEPEVIVNPYDNFRKGDILDVKPVDTPAGPAIQLHDITGSVIFSW